jgi:peptidoglycan/xylan/chitin deacetylase (PgdA/CDA1 family)
VLTQLKTRARAPIKRAIITSGLEAAFLLSTLGLFGAARGCGAIFTLHHVRPAGKAPFRANDILEITPEFLETAILTLQSEGYEFVRLDEVPARLSTPTGAPFACFTLDDGYRDNASQAQAIFTRHAVPFTIFLTKGFIDVSHSMWWETLDALLNAVDAISIDLGDGIERIAASSLFEKQAAFDRIADVINHSDETESVRRLDDAARAACIDPLAITRSLTMREDELRALADNPWVSFGAHTVSHRGLARLPASEAEAEIIASVDRVAAITGSRPASFAYPYGDSRSVSPRERETIEKLGVKIAVTTRPGVLTQKHLSELSALPRISLNGLYQQARYVTALASGIPFKLTG